MSANETQTNETEKPLKRLPVLVDPTGRAIVDRAITLKLAMLASTEGDCQELAGESLVGICREWMAATAERLSGAR